MIGREGELLLDGLAVVYAAGLLKESAEFLGTALEIGLFIADQLSQVVSPGIVALSDLLDEVDAG